MPNYVLDYILAFIFFLSLPITGLFLFIVGNTNFLRNLGRGLKWIFNKVVYTILFLLGIWFLGIIMIGAVKKVTNFSVESGSCERGGVYSRQFNCDYIYNKATYKVFYWKDVAKDNPEDNYFVGMATGLRQCRDTAIYAHRAEMDRRKHYWNKWDDSYDNWTERSYICVLTKDGRDLEKHRY